jgi:ankyrin repeat protein
VNLIAPSPGINDPRDDKMAHAATDKIRHRPGQSSCKSLLNAAASGNTIKIQELIGEGADVNFKNDDGETPLTFAAAWNQLPSLKLLLKHGADPNLADHTGGTALMLAVQHGTRQMVRALLDSGADPRQKDAFGKTAIDHVAWRANSTRAAAIKLMLRQAMLAGKNGARRNHNGA